jgi:hypothetical protein
MQMLFYRAKGRRINNKSAASKTPSSLACQTVPGPCEQIMIGPSSVIPDPALCKPCSSLQSRLASPCSCFREKFFQLLTAQ